MSRSGLEDESLYHRIVGAFDRLKRLDEESGRYHALSHRKSKIMRASKLYKLSLKVLHEQIMGKK